MYCNILFPRADGTQAAGIRLGIEDYIRQHRLQWSLHALTRVDWRIHREIGMLEDIEWAGMVGFLRPGDTLDWALANGLALASCAQNPVPDVRMARASVDNEAVGALAAAHFAQCGLRRAACIGKWADDVRRSRYQAFVRSCARFGLECTLAQGVTTGRRRDGRDLGDWLRAQPKPVGLFFHQDNDASWFRQACLYRGIRIPEDVAVIGVDDDRHACERIHPYLSSVVVPWRSIGRALALQLHRLLSGVADPEPQLVKPIRVRQRESTGFVAIADELVRRAVALIERTLGERRSIDELARLLGVSRMTLHRRCVGVFGYGAGELRQRRRVARARELLTDADMPLARIAARCGYGSQTRFGEVFRRRTGMTPAAYRRAILLEETAG